MMAGKPRVAITEGDPAGIGPEVAGRAAADPSVLDVCEPVIYAPPGEVVFPPGVLSAEAGRGDECDGYRSSDVQALISVRLGRACQGWATLYRAIWHRTGGVACWTADYATSTARHSSSGRGRDGAMPIRVAGAVGPRWWTGNWSGTSSFIAHCADDSTFKATKQPRSAERLKRAVKRGTKSSMPRYH
jgi:hypothetical protein